MGDKEEYCSQDSPPGADPLTQIMNELKGISRLEKKIDSISSQFKGELDYLKNELALMTEARKKDTIEMNKFTNSLKKVSNDINTNTEVQNRIEGLNKPYIDVYFSETRIVN